MKPRPPAAFCLLGKSKSPPPKEGGAESSEPFSVTPTQPAHTFIYTRIYSHAVPTFPALFLLSAAAGSVAPVVGLGCRGWPRVAGPHRGWPTRQGRAATKAVAAVAVALWWPPTLPLGRERPAGPPGSRRGVPSPVDPFGPRHSFGASRPADSNSDSPSGEASFPWGRARGPPPRWRRGPLGWKPRVSRSGLSYAAMRQRVRAPQGVRGPPLQPFPVVLARSPPLPRHGFHWPLAGRCRLLCRELLPMANVASSSPPPRLRGHAERFPR